MSRYSYQRPITYRQRMAVEHWISNRFKSKAYALRQAGYSEAIVRQPHKVFGSYVVRRQLSLRGYAEKLGLEVIEETEAEKLAKRSVREFDPRSLSIEEIRALKEKLDWNNWDVKER